MPKRKDTFVVLAIENYEFNKKNKEYDFWIKNLITLNFQSGSSLGL